MGADGETEEVAEHISIPGYVRGSAVRGAARRIKTPYLLRQDIGILGSLTGNWGGSSRRMQAHVDMDLRTSPAAIVMLQEAQPELVEVLRTPPQEPGSSHTRVRGDEEGQEREREERAWLCMQGHEHGNTLLVACRMSMAEVVKQRLWRRRADGRYTDKGSRARIQRTACSRVLVVEVTLREPWCGMTSVVVCNCHMHHLTAKKHTGFADSHKQFWGELSSTIVEHQVRILAGDFNMSLWVVARELRQRGLEVHFAAGFAWAEQGSPVVNSDSCGLFLIGPVASTKPMWGPRVFTSAMAEDDPELPRFVKGQGYPLSSYLPRGHAVLAMQETFTPSSIEERQRFTDDLVVLPAAVQKPVHLGKLDP